MDRRRFRIALACSAALIVGGCASSGPVDGTASSATTVVEADPLAVTVTDPPAVPIDDRTTGWVTGNVNEAIYLTFVEASDGSVSGLVQAAYLSDDGLSVESRSDSITGTLNGDDIALSVFDRSWVGDLRDGVLALTFPSDDGSLGQLRLIRGSLDDYNEYVELMRSSVAINVDVSVDDAEAAAEVANITDLFGRTNNATADLADLTGRLPASQVRVDDAVAALTPLVEDARAHFGTCDDLSYYLDYVVYGVDVVTYEIDMVKYAIEGIQTAQTKTRTAADLLDPVATSDDTAWAVYSAEEGIIAADDAISTAITQYTGSFDTANAVLAAVRNEATQACPGLVPPSPVTSLGYLGGE